MDTNFPDSALNALGSHNTLVLGDALALVERVPSRTVDLCYIDPPLLPKEDNLVPEEHTRILREHLLALAKVLQQTRRCLIESGNLFVHSEPEMNGSIRLLLDQIFGRENFRQEIIIPLPVRRDRMGIPPSHDTIFHFSFGPSFVFNPQMRKLRPNEIANQFSKSDGRGPFRTTSLFWSVVRPLLSFEWKGFQPPSGKSWRYTRDQLDQLEADGRITIAMSGKLPLLKQYVSDLAVTDVGTIWDDLTLRIPPNERTEYPKQKPEEIVERIIKMGSRESGLVLDPFCGSGTTLVSAWKCQRRWIGGDNSPNAINVATQRLQVLFPQTSTNEFISTTEALLQESNPPHIIPFLRIVTGFDDLVVKPVGNLVFGQPLEIEETREYEFKEVNSNRPLDTITNTADEYAVAFLNSEGGSIFWGIRNNDRVVVGVKLSFEDRDRLRQIVTNKLGTIRPPIDPTTYRLELHSVNHPDGIQDLVVVELVVPSNKISKPYYTGGNDAFVRLDGIKRKLAGPELTEWIIRRVTGA